MQQHLLIDADDTLWENNIYFERATEEFIDFLNHSMLTPAEVHAVIDEVERTMGYGSASLARSLQEVYQRLAEREVSEEDLLHIQRLALQITEHPIHLLEGVRATLTYLAPRHQLILLTKGQQDEQQMKIDSSDLADFFQHVFIVPEKDVDTYRRLIDELELDAQQTWMVGNSPRSDINPALEAGLNAVYIPHEHTWGLERQEIHPRGPGSLLTLKSFAELCNYF
ncbi:MAG: HAD family hydrolase [Ktedonobacteraceae bacterium]